MKKVSKPKVSVVVPVFNRERYIAKCVDSILSQRYRDYEVLLVDNNSNDQSVYIMKEYEKFYPHKIRCFSQSRKGAAAARNLGVKHARGEYLAFLDSDDLWFPEKLKIQMFFLEKKKEIDLIYTSYARFGADKKLRGDELLKFQGCFSDGKALPALLYQCFIWTSTVVMKKRVFVELGGFKESLAVGEDYDLWLRAASGCVLFGIPLVLAQYRQHDDNLMGSQITTTDDPAELRVVKNFIREYPEIKKMISARSWKKRLAAPFFDKAYIAFHKGNLLLTRRFILKAIRQYPFCFLYYRYFLLSLMPVFLIKKIKKRRRGGIVG